MALKLLPPKACSFENCCSKLAISSPVLKTRTKVFGSSSLCFHRMSLPLSKLLLRRGINQRQVRVRIQTLLHRYRIDSDHYFHCRRCKHSENMTSTRCSVGCPHHHVRMDHGLSSIQRNVAAHPNQLVLTLDGNLLVHCAAAIEPSQRCSVYRSNSGEVRTRNVILLREF